MQLAKTTLTLAKSHTTVVWLHHYNKLGGEGDVWHAAEQGSLWQTGGLHMCCRGKCSFRTSQLLVPAVDKVGGSCPRHHFLHRSKTSSEVLCKLGHPVPVGTRFSTTSTSLS